MEAAGASCGGEYIYETLDVFPSPQSPAAQSYSVIRTEIASSPTPVTPTAAPDYFSLDPDEPSTPSKCDPAVPPAPPSSPSGSSPEAASRVPWLSSTKDVVCKLPPLKPLCMILKIFLHQRELNEVFSGGIGSYGLLAMLIAQLRIFNSSSKHMFCRRHGASGQKSSVHNLGVLLVDFFALYGFKLNISEVGVSCNIAGTFFLKSSKGFLNRDRPYLLSIEDPQDEDNDIGKNSFNIYKVRSAFAMAYATLTDAKTIMNLGPNKSILETIIRPDPTLLVRKGGSNGELTFQSLLPGAAEHTCRCLRTAETSCIIGDWQMTNLSREVKSRIMKRSHHQHKGGVQMPGVVVKKRKKAGMVVVMKVNF